METATKQKKKLSKKQIIWICVGGAIILIVLLILILGGNARRQAAAAAAKGEYQTAEVVKGDITSTISGSGVLEAADDYTVTSLVQGTILTADFEEGDKVEKDQILYEIDSSDAASSLEQAELSHKQSQRNYATKAESLQDLNVTAEKAGKVVSIEVEVGDEVNPGTHLGTVRDTEHMTLEVPFLKADAANISVGQAATVTVDSTFETLPGTVKKVGAVDEVGIGGSVTRKVEISVSNPGALTENVTASASVGGYNSSAGASLQNADSYELTAKVSGKVASIAAPEGTNVQKGATILRLSSTALENEIASAQDNLRNSEISLENRYDQLSDYTITAPISGTVVEKYYKAGESYEQNKTLCIIYDLSYLTMTLSVDELDISNIKVGQAVSLTADAVEGKEFEGVVTKVSVVGSSNNGVTTYPVTIRIDKTEGLLPGMTMDAVITMESASDVLTIPTEALQRGNRVLLTKDSPSAANGEPLEGTDYVSVEVVPGVSDDDNMEIKSGLQEGDTVAYVSRSAGGFSFFGISGGGLGGAMGGMGGARGGMPGGNGGGNRQGGPGNQGGGR